MPFEAREHMHWGEFFDFSRFWCVGCDRRFVAADIHRQRKQDKALADHIRARSVIARFHQISLQRRLDDRARAIMSRALTGA